jgi:broad specificity phosphatase PhoE
MNETPALYISHAEVVIDPKVPTPNWGLSETGRARIEHFATRRLLPKNARIVASAEQKAEDTAAILADALGTDYEIDDCLGENDRSSTGYLGPEQFEAHAAKLFGEPDASVAGWETARDAQVRTISAVRDIAATHDPARLLVLVGHGCVGTLLKCHLGGRAIALAEDQRLTAHPGGGNLFVFDLAEWRLLCDWTAIEDWKGFGP